MPFNEIEYRVKLETMLYHQSNNQALTKVELDQFVNEVKTFTENLLGPFSISVLPYLNPPENICKLLIYVIPYHEKSNFQNEYYFEIKLKSG